MVIKNDLKIADTKMLSFDIMELLPNGLVFLHF